jgi:hypothetical protein
LKEIDQGSKTCFLGISNASLFSFQRAFFVYSPPKPAATIQQYNRLSARSQEFFNTIKLVHLVPIRLSQSDI